MMSKKTNKKNINKSLIIAKTSSELSFTLNTCKNPAIPKYKPPDMAAGSLKLGTNNEINAITEKEILANPISLIIAVDSSSFSLNITLAVNSGFISCFIPALPNLSPTPLNTNHLSAIL